MGLADDIEKLRRACFSIEGRLPIFSEIQVSPMTDSQMLRHRLWLLRCEIDRAHDQVKKLGLEYPPAANSFASVEPPEDNKKHSPSGTLLSKGERVF